MSIPLNMALKLLNISQVHHLHIVLAALSKELPTHLRSSGTPDMSGSNVKITKWTTETDSSNVILKTD